MGLTRSAGQTVLYHGKSDVGMVREENQDSFSICVPRSSEEALQKGLLLVVADGMGGLAQGARASQMAVEALEEIYLGEPGVEDDEETSELLLRAVHEGNRRIFGETESLPEHQSMGSTLTALALLDGRALVAHVGDSRAYRFSREAGLEQLTRDHTLVQELADRGEIEPDSLPFLLNRNVLTRGLGLQEDVEVDLIALPQTGVGETFLLCSDGLYDVVTDAEIESRLIAHGDSQADFLDDLIELARGRGAPDNVTVVVARLEPAEVPGVRDGEDSGGALPRDARSGSSLALGFLPRSLFQPLSYFLAFALGALLTLSFQAPPAGPEAAESLEESAAALSRHPAVEAFDSGELTQGVSLAEKLREFLAWLATR